MKYEQKTVLSYIASVESGKRPLHKSAAIDGSFNIPIIGASSIMGYTDDYLFNEPILVIGRVGTLGVVQSIFGKSYPSDNALIIRSKYYTFCYCALNELDYNSLNKGSTQPLSTQTDIKNIQIPLIPQSEMQQFEMHNKIDYGFGRTALLNKEYSLEEFISLLQEKLNIKHITTNMKDIKPFTRFAVCTGSGTSLWKDALKKGVNVLLTGDMKYHDALDAFEAGVCVIDATHQATEEIYMGRLAEIIKKQFNIEVIVLKQEQQLICWGGNN